MYKRQEEIKDFVPRNYYGIEIISSQINWTWLSAKKEKHLFNEAKIDETIKKLQNQKLKIEKISTFTKKKYAPQLYDLTELQRDANKLYGFSAKEDVYKRQRQSRLEYKFLFL